MLPELVASIQKQLQQPLPGTTAQLKVANAFRKTQPDDLDKVQVASTLLLLYEKEGAWHFPLIQRTSSSNPNDRHSGQISFPGGKREEADLDLEMTAVREAEEERIIAPVFFKGEHRTCAVCRSAQGARISLKQVSKVKNACIPSQD